MTRGVLVMAIVPIMVLAGCAAESAGGEHDRGARAQAASVEDAGRTYVIFADVTRSLTPVEQASVTKIVQDVVTLLPPKSTVMLFPILEDVERAPALFSGTLPDVQSTSDSVSFSVTKAGWKSAVSEKLRAVQGGPPTGRGRTCISGALRKAQAFTVDATPQRPVELLIVSDMLEDCDDSILGRRLSLEQRSIDVEVERANDLPRDPLLRLNGASVTVLLPTAPTSGAATRRPPVRQLQAFWRAVLDRSGDERANFRFGTEIPERLKALNIERDGGL